MKLTNIEINQSYTELGFTAEQIAILASASKLTTGDWQGTIRASIAYPDDVTMLRSKHPNLNLIVDKVAITFTDPEVKSICVTNWDTDGDGEMSLNEATSVAAVGSVFRNNTTITDFRELKYFTSVTNIDAQAFDGCTNLQHILSDYVKEIKGYAFRNCSSLQEIDFPNVTVLRGQSFYGCSSVSSINLPNVEVIESDALRIGKAHKFDLSLPALKNWAEVCSYESFAGKVDLPELVTAGNYFFYKSDITELNAPKLESLGERALSECTNLTKINLNSLEYNSRQMLYSCDKIQELILPKYKAKYKNYDTLSAFGTGLRGVIKCEIPNVVGIAKLCLYGFAQNTTLNHLVLPTTCTKFDNYAFDNIKVENVYCMAKTLTSVNETLRCTSVSLFVPKGKTSVYLATGFSSCKSITEYDFAADPNNIVPQSYWDEMVVRGEIPDTSTASKQAYYNS